MKLSQVFSAGALLATNTSDAATLRTSPSKSMEIKQQNHRELVISTPLSGVNDGDQFHIYHNGYSRYVRAKGAQPDSIFGSNGIDYLLDGVTNHDSWELFEFKEIQGTSNPKQYHIYNIGHGRYLNEYEHGDFPTTTGDLANAVKWKLTTNSNNKICIQSATSNEYLRMDHEAMWLTADKYTMRLQSHCLGEEEFLLVRPNNTR